MGLMIILRTNSEGNQHRGPAERLTCRHTLQGGAKEEAVMKTKLPRMTLEAQKLVKSV